MPLSGSNVFVARSLLRRGARLLGARSAGQFKLHQVEGHLATMHLVEYPCAGGQGRSELMLLDGGCRGDVKKVTRFVRDSLKQDISALKVVIVSHAHPDHQGGATELREISGARVYAPARIGLWYRGKIGERQHVIDALLGTWAIHIARSKVRALVHVVLMLVSIVFRKLVPYAAPDLYAPRSIPVDVTLPPSDTSTRHIRPDEESAASMEAAAAAAEVADTPPLPPHLATSPPIAPAPGSVVGHIAEFPGWSCVAAPGHMTHMMLPFHEESGTLYVADAFMRIKRRYLPPVPVHLPGHYVATLRALSKLKVRRILYAHHGVEEVDEAGWQKVCEQIIGVSVKMARESKGLMMPQDWRLRLAVKLGAQPADEWKVIADGPVEAELYDREIGSVKESEQKK